MVGSVKDKIMSLFKTNTTKNYIKPARISNVYGGRKRPRKQSEDKIIKAIDERIFRDIKNTFEREKEEHNWKPVKVGRFWSNNYINYVEYEGNGDRKKTLYPIKEYSDEIKPYLKKIFKYLKKTYRGKTQLTTAIKYVSSKDTDAEHEMLSKSDNIEIMIYD